jgi:hypothetical protein
VLKKQIKIDFFIGVLFQYQEVGCAFLSWSYPEGEIKNKKQIKEEKKT